MGCRVEGCRFNPGCGPFFLLPRNFFSLLSFFPSLRPPFLSFFLPAFLFSLLLSVFPFKLTPPLQCLSIFLKLIYLHAWLFRSQVRVCISMHYCIIIGVRSGGGGRGATPQFYPLYVYTMNFIAVLQYCRCCSSFVSTNRRRKSTFLLFKKMSPPPRPPKSEHLPKSI